MSNHCPFCNKDLASLFVYEDNNADVSKAMNHLLLCEEINEIYKNNSKKA